MDKDLGSIQEARDLVTAAHAAWLTWSKASQEQVDRVCAAMAEAGWQASERLGRMAQEETGYGVALHKKLKNEFGSRTVWKFIPGFEDSRRDQARYHPPIIRNSLANGRGGGPGSIYQPNIDNVFQNPDSGQGPQRHRHFTTSCGGALPIYEAAAGHHGQAAENAGAPKGLISCIQQTSLPGTQELMTHAQTAIILATGGTAMVRAAHSTGKPAYGVGPGNVPVYVDRGPTWKKQPATSLLQSLSTTPPSVPPNKQ